MIIDAHCHVWTWDILEGVISAKQWLQIFRDLPKNAPDGLTFTPEEIDALLGGNAAKIVAALS